MFCVYGIYYVNTLWFDYVWLNSAYTPSSSCLLLRSLFKWCCMARFPPPIEVRTWRYPSVTPWLTDVTALVAPRHAVQRSRARQPRHEVIWVAVEIASWDCSYCFCLSLSCCFATLFSSWSFCPSSPCSLWCCGCRPCQLHHVSLFLLHSDSGSRTQPTAGHCIFPQISTTKTTVLDEGINGAYWNLNFDDPNKSTI